MKTTMLFQLGGIALLLAAILNALASLIFFAAGAQQTTLAQWFGLLSSPFMVFGLFALFARQAERVGILSLIGFVLLVVANIADFAYSVVVMGVLAGAFTNDQLAQVPLYAVAETWIIAALVAGQVALGVSIYRAGVFPRYAGVLLAVVGLVEALTPWLSFAGPIYVVCAFAAYGWLGVTLLVGSRSAAPAPVPAT